MEPANRPGQLNFSMNTFIFIMVVLSFLSYTFWNRFIARIVVINVFLVSARIRSTHLLIYLYTCCGKVRNALGLWRSTSVSFLNVQMNAVGYFTQKYMSNICMYIFLQLVTCSRSPRTVMKCENHIYVFLICIYVFGSCNKISTVFLKKLEPGVSWCDEKQSRNLLSVFKC